MILKKVKVYMKIVCIMGKRTCDLGRFFLGHLLLSDFQIRIVCPKYFVCQSISERYPHDIIHYNITSKLFQNYDSKHKLTVRLRLFRVK